MKCENINPLKLLLLITMIYPTLYASGPSLRPTERELVEWYYKNVDMKYLEKPVSKTLVNAWDFRNTKKAIYELPKEETIQKFLDYLKEEPDSPIVPSVLKLVGTLYHGQHGKERNGNEEKSWAYWHQARDLLHKNKPEILSGDLCGIEMNHVLGKGKTKERTELYAKLYELDKFSPIEVFEVARNAEGAAVRGSYYYSLYNLRFLSKLQRFNSGILGENIIMYAKKVPDNALIVKMVPGTPLAQQALDRLNKLSPANQKRFHIDPKSLDALHKKGKEKWVALEKKNEAYLKHIFTLDLSQKKVLRIRKELLAEEAKRKADALAEEKARMASEKASIPEEEPAPSLGFFSSPFFWFILIALGVAGVLIVRAKRTPTGRS